MKLSMSLFLKKVKLVRIVLMKSPMKAILWTVGAACAIALIIYHWVSCGAATAREIVSFYASLATIIGVIGALIAASIAVKTYRSNNSIKKWEMIKNIYAAFLEKDLYEFYKKIQNGKEIDIADEEQQRLLNKALTLFDDLEYFHAQGLLDEEAWVYIACEIQNFALNNSVWKYIDENEKPYLEKKFYKDIIPFTGFIELLDELPVKLKANWPRELEDRIKSYHQKKNENNASK